MDLYPPAHAETDCLCAERVENEAGWRLADGPRGSRDRKGGPRVRPQRDRPQTHATESRGALRNWMARKSGRVKRHRSLQRGAELAYQNALLLLPEAEILHGRGSYGHSAALSMHAIEELGKAEILIMRKERIRNVTDWRTARYRKKPVLIPAPLDWLNHPHKYWHFLNYLKLGEIVARRVSPSAAIS